ncbi:mannose-1-phosphate guanylyltransferase [uncultured Pseudokineococcus sp.]|uniref:mannose-1-phosphate guanylyltransferase n=1 Tax=uncultured Pseudokineococcus sp. TaxID=1642928 RepID=UPI00262F22C0|nr:mannose-1-phosphate guanylyltransferase [uncultured Pseudokineococcus sp.]
MPSPAPSKGTSLDHFWAVVPAGGSGTRLWPLSRAGAPKFLHDLTSSGRTLVQSTWDRLVPLATPERLLLVTGEVHAGAVRGQLPQLERGNLLLEPSPRDSMAAIGLAAAVVARRDPEAVVGSFAADHLIPDARAFGGAVRQAVAVAQEGHVVTIGIQPTSAATGFGYVRTGEPLDVEGAPDAVRATGFTEKPDAATAERYVAGGDHRWNAGMFVARADVLLGHLQAQLPQLHAGLLELAEAHEDLPAHKAADVVERVWPTLTKIAIDHAIAEPVAAAGGVAVVKGSFSWDDVGDWDALASLVPDLDGSSLRVLGDLDSVVVQDSTGVVVPRGQRTVAVIGLDDVVVVDTDDAVLVTTRARAQEVKGVVEALRAKGRGDLL